MISKNGAVDELRTMAVNETMIANEVTSRMAFFQKFFDPRRSIPDECGHPASVSAITIQQYQNLYDLDPIAARVVECISRESWQVNPLVFEREAAKRVTPFELKLDAICKKLRGERSWFLPTDDANPLWEWVRRGDEISGIGSFGLLLLGFNDGLPPTQPIAGAMTANEEGRYCYQEKPDIRPIKVRNKDGGYGDHTPTLREIQGDDPLERAGRMMPRTPPSGEIELLSIRAFPEYLVQVAQFEMNPSSPRRGMPVRYFITLNDPRTMHQGGGIVDTSMFYVHWTRVLHLADDLGASEVFGRPRMQQVLPRLLDLQKIYGGDAEGYWKNVIARIFLETHPGLGGQVKVDLAALKSMMENMENGLQRWAALMGMSAKTVAPTVVDPTPHINTQIEAICIKLGIPKRVFMGSERGDLASSQDDQAWNDRLKFRQNSYITPRIIVPLIDRLICVGALPEPAGYHVQWPDLTSQSDADRAGILVQKAQAYATYISGQVESFIPPMEWMTKFDNLTEEQAKGILEGAAQAIDAGTVPPLEAPQGGPSDFGGDPPGGGQPSLNVGNVDLLEATLNELRAEFNLTDYEVSQLRVVNCGGEGGTMGPCPAGETSGGSSDGDTATSLGKLYETGKDLPVAEANAMLSKLEKMSKEQVASVAAHFLAFKRNPSAGPVRVEASKPKMIKQIKDKLFATYKAEQANRNSSTIDNCGGPGSGIPGPCAGGASTPSGSDNPDAVEPPPGFLQRMVGKVKGAYDKFKDRYGTAGAIAMMATMAATIPLPGNIIGVIGAAEVIRYAVRSVRGAQPTPQVATAANAGTPISEIPEADIEEMVDEIISMMGESGITVEDREAVKAELLQQLKGDEDVHQD